MIQQLKKAVLILVSIPLFAACQKANFFKGTEYISSGLDYGPGEEEFIDPPATEPPVISPLPEMPKPPGTKAQKLAEIEFLSCPISNKSDEFYGYSALAAPVRPSVFARIEHCTAEAYPETPLDADATSTMQRLLGADPELRQYIYSSLWYRPPFTDHFELYFGLSSLEARMIFCYGQSPQQVLAGDLLTSEYWQNQPDGYWSWLNDRQAQQRFRTVQGYRQQLRDCLK